MVGRKFTCCSLGAVRSPFAAMRLYVELRTEHVKLKSHTHILPILLVFLTSTGPFSTELWELRSWSHNATKVFRCMLILAKSLDMVEGMVLPLRPFGYHRPQFCSDRGLRLYLEPRNIIDCS